MEPGSVGRNEQFTRKIYWLNPGQLILPGFYADLSNQEKITQGLETVEDQCMFGTDQMKDLAAWPSNAFLSQGRWVKTHFIQPENQHNTRSSEASIRGSEYAG